MNLVERLQSIGFTDKSWKIDVIPQINNAPDSQNKRTKGEVLRRGDDRVVSVHRSLLFRKPGCDVIVDTLKREVWTPKELKAGRPEKLLPYGYEYRPDSEIDDENFRTVMQLMD